MSRTSLRRVATIGLTLAIGSLPAGCLEKKKAPAAGGEANGPERPKVEVDTSAFKSSWIVGLAADPQPLVSLAETSGGWRLLFTGETRDALDAFLDDAEKSPQARIGAARAAHELARAHIGLSLIARAVTPQVLKAQSTRPGAKASAPWRAYVAARLAMARGQDPGKALGEVPPDSAPAPFAAALTAEAAQPLGALLRGEAAGADADIPPGVTDAYATRLKIRSLVAAGKLREARARLKRLDPMAPDILVGEGAQRISLRDPAAADVGARVYASLVVETLADVQGWPLLLKADALRMLGRHDDALAALDALDAARPAEAGLEMLVLSEALSAADLGHLATALRARLLADKGDEAGARAAAESLGRDSIVQRVNKAWAGSFVGLVDAEAFPEDRTLVTRALLEAVTAGGDTAPGVSSISDLMLVDRHVDAVQRRFAEALVRMDRPALAVKMREAAEDKAKGQSPSARNSLSALTAAALDNVGIGRPRVALKYLSRMAEALPAASGPAEMLRDLLSHRAMEHSGGATSGQ